MVYLDYILKWYIYIDIYIDSDIGIYIDSDIDIISRVYLLHYYINQVYSCKVLEDLISIIYYKTK